jgi:hypothetical protein
MLSRKEGRAESKKLLFAFFWLLFFRERKVTRIPRVPSHPLASFAFSKKQKPRNRRYEVIASIHSFRNSLELLLQLCQTGSADPLSIEVNDVVDLATEDAGGLILLQYNAILINKDLQGISLFDIQGFTDLNGQNNSSQFVYLTNHTG